MGTRTIRLDDDVYERLKRQKRDDETFSEAVDRLVGGESLAALGEIFTDEEVTRMEAAISEADAADAAEVDELLDRFDDR